MANYYPLQASYLPDGLRQEGIISCRRGYMQVVRREQLQRHACECHRSLKAQLPHVWSAQLVSRYVERRRWQPRRLARS
jgi:hypothetical protein